MEQLPDAPEARSGCRSRVLPKVRLFPRTAVAVKHSRARTSDHGNPKHTSDRPPVALGPSGDTPKAATKSYSRPMPSLAGLLLPSKGSARVWDADVLCLVPEVTPGCGRPGMAQGCDCGVTGLCWAVLWLPRGAAGDAQGCVAAPAEHSSPSRYHLSWEAACFPSSNNQQVMPGGDTEAELRAGDSRVGDVALLEMLLAPQGQGPWVVSQW